MQQLAWKDSRGIHLTAKIALPGLECTERRAYQTDLIGDYQPHKCQSSILAVKTCPNDAICILQLVLVLCPSVARTRYTKKSHQEKK